MIKHFHPRLPICVLSGLILVACSSSSTQATDLLVVTPDPRIHAEVPSGELTALNCEPTADKGRAQSKLVLDGPCRFTVLSAIRCVHKTDDFYAYIKRELPNGGRMDTIINVEHYAGPGRYVKRAELYMQVDRNGALYGWQTWHATAEIASGERTITIEPAAVPAQAGTPARGTETIWGVATCDPG
jgi:hypothetical protein